MWFLVLVWHSKDVYIVGIKNPKIFLTDCSYLLCNISNFILHESLIQCTLGRLCSTYPSEIQWLNILSIVCLKIYFVSMLNAISALSAIGVAILPHFLHSVRHNEAIADLPCSKCFMGRKMAKKLEFRGICSLNFYYINLVFHIFCICPIMSQFQFIYKTWYFYMGYEMGKHLTSHKSAHSFFSGKNPDP